MFKASSLTIKVLICFVMVRTSKQQLPASPCPHIFTYEYDGSQWFGLINIQNPEFDETQNMILNVSLSLNAKLSTSYVGKIELLGDGSEILLNLRKGLNIKYKVNFPLVNKVPAVTSIIFNKKELCSQYVESSTLRIYLYNTFKIDVSHGHEKNAFHTAPRFIEDPRLDEHTEQGFLKDIYTINTANTEDESPNSRTLHPKNTSFDIQSICGKSVTSLNKLIVNGESTKPGEWPWLVALYSTKSTETKFMCGGSLILDNIAVTAAHCVKRNDGTVKKEDLLITLGAFNLEKLFDGQIRELNDIIVHPSYKSRTNNDDIALLKFRRVVFTDRIKPVCLWSQNDDLSLVVGSTGTVVGWGQDESGSVANEPRKSKVPIVSTVECRGTARGFFNLTSDTTLCAGDRDGSGPCNGDSGGGLYLYDSENSRWSLRGIVSHSLTNPNSKFSCNLNEYIVYTDSAKYIKWIQSHF